MGKIVLLDELTINQIAAGEVIERPASVVKEMLENSIDAGATNITVEIKNGGISFIRVSDNGKGISKDDVELAFERHATSKIRSASDLQEVKSMGFRGEALASIAAISNIELISKTNEQETGTKIIVEGGKILNIEETGCSTGTVITVRNLFFNTPVRYKFLKKDFTETGYIEDVITRIALVHPEIAIKLINTGKVVILTNGDGKLQSVVYSIYGRDIATEILPVSYEYEYIRVTGAIGKPVIARSNRGNQIFFVNKRYIKNKTLTSAVEQAYKGIIPLGKFGFSILNLEMDSKKVDVNVHPAKLEVRFEDDNIAFKAVYHAIKNTLLSADLISDREKNKEIKDASKDAFKIQPVDGGLFGKTQEKHNMKSDVIEIEDSKAEQTNKENSIEEPDVFERLKILQKELKEQIKVNPEIKLTENFQKIKNKYDNIIDKSDDIIQELDNKLKETQEDQEQKSTKVDVENKEESSEYEIKKEEEKEQTEENQVIEKQEEQKVEKTVEEKINADSIEESIEEKEKTGQTVEQAKKRMETFEQLYKELFGKEPYGGRKQVTQKKEEDPYKINEEDLNDNISVFENIEEYKKISYKFIGIAFKTYIILEMNQELYIMDQHAAHERILYEKVKENFYKDQDKECQMLLLPDIITLSSKEMAIAKDNFDLFEKAGFMIEEFGEDTIKLSGVPPVCINLKNKELFLETLDEINTVARTAKQEKEEKFIATVACKAAVKANMALTEEEVTELMESLLKLPNPFSCPHGRPTVIKMSKNDLERKFARK